MRKVLAIGFLGLFTLTFLASCGSQKVHCDAYGGRHASSNHALGADVPS